MRTQSIWITKNCNIKSENREKTKLWNLLRLVFSLRTSTVSSSAKDKLILISTPFRENLSFVRQKNQLRMNRNWSGYLNLINLLRPWKAASNSMVLAHLQTYVLPNEFVTGKKFHWAHKIWEWSTLWCCDPQAEKFNNTNPQPPLTSYSPLEHKFNESLVVFTKPCTKNMPFEPTPICADVHCAVSAIDLLAENGSNLQIPYRLNVQ